MILMINSSPGHRLSMVVKFMDMSLEPQYQLQRKIIRILCHLMRNRMNKFKI